VTDKYKSFPPFVGHIRIPVSSRKSASAGAAMYQPAKKMTTLLRRVSLAYLNIAGPRLLPGVARGWTPPMEKESWSNLLEQLEANVGPIEEFAIHERRRQSVRSGFTLLLLRRGSPIGFVRVVRDLRERIRREYEVLSLLQAAHPLSFRAPEPISWGDFNAWSYIVTSAVPPGEHRVAEAPPVETIIQDIQRALSPLSSPAGTPPHWVPMHGDIYTNLRDTGSGQLVLYDWESVRWGPPGADEVLYWVSKAVLTGDPIVMDKWPEAKAYWQARFAARAARRDPKGLGAKARQLLEG
jgi:hypothetical protein